MEFNTSSASFEQRVNIITRIVANMKTRAKSTGQAGIILTGDPGVGKTSFIRFFAKLAGLEQVTIEAPHITEEHVINIPFIVFNPVNDKEERDVEHLDESDYKIVLADSNLFSRIKQLKKIPDDQLLKMVYASGKDSIGVWEELGGTKDEIPEDIQDIRKHFDAMLFLDEYFRQTSTRIRNMLRGILNGKLGNHDIPENTYVIYATNLKDEGIENIPLNNDFKEIKFGTPNKDDWFAYIVSKYENDKKNPLKKEVVEKFHKLLDEEHLNNNDTMAEVRTSPRRWEQLLTYINASIPPKNQQDAKNLMTNVKLNFKNYLTGAHSSLYEKVTKAVSELIEETSDIRHASDDVNADEDWRTTLEHQIQKKMDLGGHRAYVPIISGMPGIGKTSEAAKVATDLGLRYIYIECSKLSAEDVTGIPLSKRDKVKRDNIETEFSAPKLYLEIMNDVKKQDAHFLTTKEGKELGAAKYKNQEWKYLIFFDEFNRVKPNVFNALRQVILEKKFSGGGKEKAYELPAGSIVIGAINPKDHGAIPLTHHMADVVDIIDAKSSWSNTKAYIKDKLMPKVTDIQQPIKDAIYDFIVAFADKFKSKSGDIKQRQFNLDIANQDIYISPREYSDWFSNACEHFHLVLRRKLKKMNAKEYTEEEVRDLEKALKEVVYDQFESTMSPVLNKQEVSDAPQFFHDVKNWIMRGDAVQFGEGIFFKKAKTEKLGDILKPYFDNLDLNLSDAPEFKNFMVNNDVHKFKEELTEFLLAQVEKRFDAEEKLFAQKHKKREMTDGQEHFVDEEVSQMENFIRNLIHGIVVLKLSHESKELIKVAVTSVCGQFMKMHEDDEFQDAVLEFNGKMRRWINTKLKAEVK